MLKVHGRNRVAQRTGNRIGSLNAGSPGSVIAGTESHYHATAVQLCPGSSYPQRNSPSQNNITATGDVQQPSQGLKKVGGCIPRAASLQDSSKMKSSNGTEGKRFAWSLPCMLLGLQRVYTSLSLPHLFRESYFIKKLLTTKTDPKRVDFPH